MRFFLPKPNLILSITAIFLLAGCAGGQIDSPSAEDETPLPSPEVINVEGDIPADSEGLSEQTFDELGISLIVPDELFVIKEPIFDADDPSIIDSYLFYIQDYGYPEGPASGDFQIYGFYQFELPKISWEELAEIQADTTNYEYVNYVEVGGLRGFDTQYSGQRNRFVYFFHYQDGVLILAISSPTEFNKNRADAIINTLTVLGD